MYSAGFHDIDDPQRGIEAPTLEAAQEALSAHLRALDLDPVDRDWCLRLVHEAPYVHFLDTHGHRYSLWIVDLSESLYL